MDQHLSELGERLGPSPSFFALRDGQKLPQSKGEVSPPRASWCPGNSRVFLLGRQECTVNCAQTSVAFAATVPPCGPRTAKEGDGGRQAA